MGIGTYFSCFYAQKFYINHHRTAFPCEILFFPGMQPPKKGSMPILWAQTPQKTIVVPIPGEGSYEISAPAGISPSTVTKVSFFPLVAAKIIP